MRVLVLHNHYQQSGGEDEVFSTEADLLEAHGHQVVRYTVHNDQIGEMNALPLVQATLWNNGVYRKLRALMRAERPEVAHFHNTFPLLSPSAYYAARAEGVPVVQSLQNYRLLCPNAFFFRDGRVCEDCLGKAVPWPGVLHGCYRESRAATGTVAALLAIHRALGTWQSVVDAYIVPTEFARHKFIEGGLSAEKLAVKPNFLYHDPGPGPGRGGYALFVGRLSPEKGLDTLLCAWERLGGRIPLKIVGDGPLSCLAAAAAGRIPGVEWLNRQSLQQVYALLQHASFLVVPSRWYEGLPRIIVDAFAAGTPVIASNLGAMSSLITHNHNGLHFRPGDAADLVAQVESVLADPENLVRMRRETRTEFETKYAAQENYRLLMDIYAQAMARSAPILQVANEV